eukprot:1213865-Pyramimonas_sp.AAC.1
MHQDAATLSDKRLSDHAVLALHIDYAPHKLAHVQPIPDFLFSLPLFSRFFELLAQHSNDVSASPTLQWRAIKANMVEAARLTRNHLLQLPG